MNELSIETKNGNHLFFHVNDDDLEDFILDVEVGYCTNTKVTCEKTGQTLVFDLNEISSYSFGKIGEESQ
ncbi:hypothetical protein IHP72_15440 [Bacillus pumilus]|uniref:hypothetical protein n=1 Tax=Bacillus pumilus TaxID=1408 RepID=UPI001B3A384F|nr:hypothetical protein [Bacillus pumilus]MBQ4817647.1 hypothetical protein [Bacillus pumilus]